MTSRRLVVRLVAVAWLLVLGMVCLRAHATTYQDVTVVCPLCNAQVYGRVGGSSMVSHGYSTDFRPQGGAIALDLESLLMCKACGFAAGCGQFEKPAGLDKEAVRRALAAVKSSPFFCKVDRAIAIERVWTNDLRWIARLAIGAKWLADDTGEPQVIQQRIDEAIKCHEAVLATAPASPVEPPRVTYLIGELYRQAGKREQAIEWLLRAEKITDERLTVYGYFLEPDEAFGSPRMPDARQLTLVRRQLALARAMGKSNAELIKAFDGGTDHDKLAAVVLLRDCTDPKVIDLIKAFCLNGPEIVREAALNALEGTEPRPHHLPVYIGGLQNENRGVAQESANAIRKLKVREAASALVEGPKKPRQQEDQWLLGAQNDTATEKELISALGKGERIATQAALALARRGSNAGREVLLKNHMLLHQDEDFKFLRNAFVPADFDVLVREMQQREADLRATIAKMRAEWEQTLADPKASSEDQKKAHKGLQLPTLDDEWFLPHWMPLLAGTGNPKARAICLQGLESRGDVVRLRAVQSLVAVYDDSIGDLLAGRLAEEEPWMQTEILHTMTSARDTRHIDVIVNLVNRPTSVYVKLAWINALQALAPERATPRLREWSDSPNAELAAAARKALAAR